MNSLFGEWYRTASIEPTNELLESRWKGIEVFLKKVDSAKVLELARCFIRLPWKNQAIHQEFIGAFQDADAAFPVRNNEVELQVLSGSAIVALVETGNEFSDFAACVLDAAFARGLRKEPVVPEILAVVEKYISSRSLAIREIAPRTRVTGVDLRAQIDALKAACVPNQATQLAQPLEIVLTAINESINKLAQAAESSISSLERVQNLYSEESNIVWWVFGETSRDEGERFKQLPAGFASILAGKELADLTTSIPGRMAGRAYLDKILHNSTNKKMTLSHVAGELPKEWLSRVNTDENLLDLCPVLYTIHEVAQGRDVKASAEIGRKQLGILSTDLTPVEIALQAYREFLLSKKPKEK